MGHGIFGYIEVKDDQTVEWKAYKKIDLIPRAWPVQLVFGYGTKSINCTSLFKDRGLPIDSSEEVREEYMEKQVAVGHCGEFREYFGHSHVYSHELPNELIEKFDDFDEPAEEHDHARLLVWFNR